MAKSKYEKWLTTEGLLLIQGWARDGLTNADIAFNMEVTEKTLYEWQNKYSVISDTLKDNKPVADRKVENELFKNATGYWYEDTVAFKVKTVIYNKDGKRVKETEEIVTKVIMKWKPADPTSQFFWLKNRKPSEWRDRFQQDIYTPEPIKTMDMSNISTDDLKQLRGILKKNEKE